MAELKREYVVPLRRKTKLAPRWRRSKKAVSVLKEFISKHMKTETVIICSELNEYIWKHGAKNPPGKVSVIALKTELDGENKTLVNLLEVGIDKQKQLYTQAKEEVSKSLKEAKETLEKAKEEDKVVDVEETPKETKKEEKPAKETKKEVKKDE